MNIQIIKFDESTKVQIKIECDNTELKEALKSIKKVDRKLKKV
jgi:hypothetical protein